MDLTNATGFDETLELIGQLLPFVIPLALLQLSLLVFTIADLAKKQQTKTLSPLVWIIIALCVNTIGPILYIIFGRSETAKHDSELDDI